LGARLLALQDADGQWAGGAYFPKDFDFDGPETAPGAGQPWTATTWSLNFLRDFGMPAVALRNTAELLRLNSTWEYEDLPYWDGEVDCCINGFTVRNGLWLGVDVSKNAEWFVEHQMAEGGWNCEWVDGATRASVHSTLNSLRAIIEYQAAGMGSEALDQARQRAEEYLLERQLMFKLSNGEEFGPWLKTFRYPVTWRYSTLGVLEYFRRVSEVHGDARDSRMQLAIDTVVAARQSDGRWLQGGREPGRMWFEFDVPTGEPSPWVTFMAFRVLKWWES
jgi:hypothetical protein